MKKGKTISIAICLLAVLFLVSDANAELFNRGTDNLGFQLIYDSDLNITWYDYTNSPAYWQTQMNWASGLSVSGGDLVGVYDDWRLPTALNQNGTGPCSGYNCTGSEMGHLFYTELGNTAPYDTSGNPTDCGWSWDGSVSRWVTCLVETGDFQNLNAGVYWSGTEYAADTDHAWIFFPNYGYQFEDDKYTVGSSAIAVRPGDVSVVPEPISSILFVTGGAMLGLRRFIKRKIT